MLNSITKTYQRYQKHKKISNNWLVEIPEEWDVEYLKNLGYFASSGIDKKTEEGEPLVKMVNYTDIYGNHSLIIDSQKELMTVSCPAWKIKECNLIEGDLVFTPSSETIEDIGLSALIKEKLLNTVFSYHVIRFRFTKNFNNSFKKYLCNNNFVLQQFSEFAKGTTRQILDRNDFKNIQVIAPPIITQQSIANFLDQETGKIDGLIEKKQKLVELLREKRTALISQTVTKGLNPNAKMKNSGVEWIGKIPEKWGMKRLKHISDTRVSNVDKKSEDEIFVKLCNYVDVYKNELIDENIDFMRATATETQISRFELKKGDVIITKDSETPDDIGVPAYVNLKSTKLIVCGYHLSLITPKDIFLHGKYLFRLLQSKCVKDYFEMHSNGVTRFGLDTYSILNINTILPSIQEQQSIVDFLDRETGKIDKAIVKIDEQIEKLKEYRSTLISKAVTGKIKV